MSDGPGPLRPDETSARGDGPESSGRWELVRALGALTHIPPASGGPVCAALGLPAWSAAAHTRVFVLDLPPYASIHLGRRGQIGGEGADRVAGMWRALGLDPPADADHLAALTALYAELGESGEACRTEAARRRLDHAREVLLAEHIVAWLPGYLRAARRYPEMAAWADLTEATLAHEVTATLRADRLAPALVDAPPPLEPGFGPDDLLDSVTVPLRSGLILTHADIERAGHELGLGVRRGERRYSLKAMLDQDAVSTVSWLAAQARLWSDAHREWAYLSPSSSSWWAQRARFSAEALHSGLGEARA